MGGKGGAEAIGALIALLILWLLDIARGHDR